MNQDNTDAIAQSLARPDPGAAVRAELIRLLYRNLPVPFLTTAGVTIVVALVLGPSVSHSVLWPWLVASLLQAPLRATLWRRYWSRPRRPPSEAPLWERLAVFGNAYTGLTWGIGSYVLFVPGRLDLQLLLLTVQIGLITGAVFASGAHVPAVLAFMYLCAVPFSVRMFMEGDGIHIALGVMCVLFLVAITRLAVGFHRTLRDSVSLRFENLDLVEELRVQKEGAEKANVAKSRFLAAASHDLRQPLQALTLFGEALRRRPLPEPERRIVEDMRTSISALDGLFNALLDISQLDADMVAPRTRAFPVGPVIQRIAVDFGPEAARKGIRLLGAPSRRFALSDPVLFERIARNLVSNAVRYTERGGVVFGCRGRGDQVRFEVWDSGVGIPPEHHEAIFAEFFQLANPERDRTKGLGLGLAIVDRLARLLGHRIEVRSVPGFGSRFSLVMPKALPEDIPPPRSDFSDVKARLAGTLVAVVDDEPEILKGMRYLMDSWNCQAVLARSKEELLAAPDLVQRCPDIILCDFRLQGGVTGIEVIQDLREEFNKEIPALLISGDIAPKRLREAQDAGLPMMHKPIEPDQLYAGMARLLGLS